MDSSRTTPRPDARPAAPIRPRRCGPADLARILEGALETLDHLTHVPVPLRLEVIARSLAVRLEAAGWWVGHVDRTVRLTRVASGVGALRTERRGTGRARLEAALREPHLQWGDPRDPLALEGSSMSLWAGDDPRLAAQMDGWGGVLTLAAAGGYDPDARQWSMALFGDRRSPDLRDAETVVLALVQACLGFPRGPH